MCRWRLNDVGMLLNDEISRIITQIGDSLVKMLCVTLEVNVLE